MFLYVSLEAKEYYNAFLKVSFLSAYNAVHNFDTICISGSYLNFQIFSNDDKLSMPVDNMFWVDHPSENRRGGVCVYYKENLPVRLYNISYPQQYI